MKDIVKKVQNITNSYISYLYNNNSQQDVFINNIYHSLSLMLNNKSKYNFNKSITYEYDNITEDRFQQLLSNISEKDTDRKKYGVYYTPRDIISFILDNCLYYRYNDNKIILKYTIFDPTCGAGEFLLTAFEKKVMLAKSLDYLSDDDVINILNTIYGNDISAESVEITRIRLFFLAIKYIKSENKYIEIADILKRNIYNIDFVTGTIDKKFDIIIGNPPYIEDSKSLSIGKNKYGNIYANILENSVNIAYENGIIGFIIPLSYISTQRMRKIRKFIESRTSKQLIFNYADRPSCLFPQVHQKLSILIAGVGNSPCEVLTSSYIYWNKSKRGTLFDNQIVFKNKFINDLFYPKIGNRLENSIYKKVLYNGNCNILDLTVPKSDWQIYLNMRACFWIKAFSFKQKSKEYKEFYFDKSNRDFILCILNSSLFFLYWNIVSDCWHITQKDLQCFKIPTENIDNIFFTNKRKELENELESTKEYIGSKQVQYEYKHKMCKSIIDSIDEELGKLYMLSREEIIYIKKYAEKYRLSLGDEL